MVAWPKIANLQRKYTLDFEGANFKSKERPTKAKLNTMYPSYMSSVTWICRVLTGNEQIQIRPCHNAYKWILLLTKPQGITCMRNGIFIAIGLFREAIGLVCKCLILSWTGILSHYITNSLAYNYQLKLSCLWKTKGIYLSRLTGSLPVGQVI